LRQAALDVLIPPCDPSADCTIGVVNTTGIRRQEVVETDAIQGSQTTLNGKSLVLVEAHPFGFSSYQLPAEVWEVSARQEGDLFILENSNLRAVFRADGRLISLFSHDADREALTGEGGNQFIMYDDDPVNWDAWDVDVYHHEKQSPPLTAMGAEIVESGTLRASLRFTYQINEQSKITQTVSLTCISQVLEFDHIVDWHESKKLLRVEFPVNVRSDFATYEMQHGVVRRPTHYNTPYDLARFEVPAHRWGDLSEPGFGVALINDCKYGYRIHENVIALSLLRSPKSPDPVADMGTHQFRCGLLVHDGADYSDVIREATSFNIPLLIRGSETHLRESFFEIENGQVIIDALKKAETSDDLIMRLYEPEGYRGKALLALNLPISRIALCNLLEGDIAEIELNDGIVELDFTPFQVITLKLSR